MQQRLSLMISQLGQEELSNLLARWWIASVQSLVAAVGPEVASAHLKTYYISSGRAAAHHIKKMAGLPSEIEGEITPSSTLK